ncbi:MAG: hypothetical protein JSS04_21855 [Proteobacteria bacterium]|nr:hypothetical protein [Pseudomonadota bacterium]
MTIEGVRGVDASGNLIENAQVGLTERLAVILGNPGSFDPGAMVLVLDGQPIKGLKGTLYLSDKHALVFRLERTADNMESWQPLLALPTLKPRAVTVGLWKGLPAKDAKPDAIPWKDGEVQTFKLQLVTHASIFWGFVAVVGVLFLVGSGATRTNILKDALLPQLPPKRQPFSLGRTQMAFWFTLVFASYVFLYILLWDPNTITPQTLMLMGLSAGTAAFAIAIDAAKDTPVGRANEKLRAIGLASYDDVVRLTARIDAINEQLKVTSPPANEAELRVRLQDLMNQMQTWRDTVAPFASGGLYADLMTDVNGPALHRMQIVVWTVTLGFVFVIDVYRTLTMPEFSATLLALMGVTSAGYLGFKLPEKQN